MITIGKFPIGLGRTFLIAEIGNNHNGDLQLAKQMIEKAKESGADCVKFQMRQMSEVYRRKSLDKGGEDLGTEYVVDLLKKIELSVDEHASLIVFCKAIDIMYMCTPWDEISADILNTLGVVSFKVSSADLTNIPLLDKLSSFNKPLIISTGMSSDEEIKKAIDFLNIKKVKFILLHCNSTYPAPIQDINLKYMESLKKQHRYIGYSGHERGINVSLAAAALGACVIERHFTFDRNMEGPDHAASLMPEDFTKMVSSIREIEAAMGAGATRLVSQGEMINRENLGKSLVARTALKKGVILTNADISVRSPGQGLSPQKINDLVGKVLQRDIEEEDFFYESDLNEKQIKPSKYFFSRPWGIPVRYHDINKYSEIINPDLFEFHLSYSDMDLNPGEFMHGEYANEFVVHAPELFKNSVLMDLASENEDYRLTSIFETQRVIEITKMLKTFFPKCKRPLIVANIGGFSMDAPFNQIKIENCYEIFSKSLKQLDLSGVELIPQTMAPFPWHFGGQRFQNLFVRIEEIIEVCKKLKLRMCFDISHSKLTCNYLGYDFYRFAEIIAPYTAHIHIGDARALNGEGLQIGDGEIDFNILNKILAEGCPQASFIPEIWQGHKNNGDGFWIALERLNGKI